MAGSTLKAGILGTGFMGQQHGRRLVSMPGVEISAICDTNIEGASKLKESLGCAAGLYGTFDAMLAEAKLDMLYVCLPPFAHAGQVELAAARGIHLFLEKPIAANAKKARAMVEAIEKAGVVSQVGFHMRFRKGVKRLKALMDAGEAGAPTLFDGRYFCNMLGGSWWRDINGSGGQVYEQVIHLFDLANYLLGTPVAAHGFLSNICHAGIHDYTIEDTSVAAVRYQSGALASVCGSNCALPDHFIGDWRVVCGKAVLEYRSTGDWRDKDECTLWTYDGDKKAQESIIEDGDPYAEEDEDFVNAVRTGGPTVTPARCGLDAIAVVSAVIASAGTQKNVSNV
jgi:predicted dehydrogenase